MVHEYERMHISEHVHVCECIQTCVTCVVDKRGGCTQVSAYACVCSEIVCVSVRSVCGECEGMHMGE